MSQTRLIPLLCPGCQAPLPARPGEVAWVCQTCGQAALLDEASGSRKITVFFSTQIASNGTGRPFWVAGGKLSGVRRSTYKGDQSQAMAEFWGAGRLFYIPAWDLPVEEAVAEGIRLLSSPVVMHPGSRTAHLPVTVSPRDLRPLAEFMVISIEAGRKDALRELIFQVDLEPPQLWILP